MKRLLCAAALALGLAGGCPRGPTDEVPTDPVTARITISSATGLAPLLVKISGVESTSIPVGTLTYAWDLGDGTTADTLDVLHTYDTPGMYHVELHVTDASENVGTASVDVRVDATPAAVILADTNADLLPLMVQFDGTESRVDNAEIVAYAWDFGDGSEISEQPAPAHTYEQANVYTVTLRVVATTGREGTTTTRITAGGSIGSLDLSGEQKVIVTIPETATEQHMFEVWFKADPAGGQLFRFADGLLYVVLHPELDSVELHMDPQTQWATVPNLAGQWHHIALLYSTRLPSGSAAVFMDGEYLFGAPHWGPGDYETFTRPPGWDDIDWTSLTVGDRFSGRIAELRWWSEETTTRYRWWRLDPSIPNLLGYWRLDDGAGQTLTNQLGVPGVCYTSPGDEPSDPVWSADGPDFR
ncbi:MAG: PKD domain-containing protein [Phycisphaerae bacterium]